MGKYVGIIAAMPEEMEAIKNKMAPPFRSSQFEVKFGKGIDRYGELITLASEFEIIKLAHTPEN